MLCRCFPLRTVYTRGNRKIQYTILMIRIAVIGAGNVGSHLAKALRMPRAIEADAETIAVNPRTLDGLPSDADLYLICVKDDAIASVADSLPQVEGIVAHTSGSVDIGILSRHKRRGVFYPLQTFTKGVNLDYRQIPFFIEGSDEEVCRRLCGYASLISDTVKRAGSATRARLHLAAVFACNFTNCLYGIADDILKESGLDFKVLLPLIDQSVAKVADVAPRCAQTGPAARGDLRVMSKQEAMLASHSDYQEIYTLISKYIFNLYNK